MHHLVRFVKSQFHYRPKDAIHQKTSKNNLWFLMEEDEVANRLRNERCCFGLMAICLQDYEPVNHGKLFFK